MRRQGRGRYSGPPPLPKPYKFVTVTEGRVPRERPAGHDDYEKKLVNGVMRGVITALTPVHVGSGQIELTGRREPSLEKAHLRSGGRPVIPGSSLKGSIRSMVEAISASCIRITRAPRNRQPKDVRECQAIDVHGDREKQQLCVACRMFGALGYQGQVRFSDAVQRENQTETIQVPSLYAPRTRERLYYEGGQIKGRKFYEHGQLAKGNVPIEVCPAGSHFDFAVHFDNLAPGELGLLLIALGQGVPRLHPKLGGAKPACLGTISIEIGHLEVLDMDSACTQYEAEPMAVEVKTYLDTARSLVLGAQLDQLATILKYPHDRECPDRNY